MMACSVVGCEVRSDALGLCMRHYQRLKKHGSAIAPGVEERQRGGECSIDGCPTRTHAKGLCQRHYLRLMHRGDVGFTLGHDVDLMAPRICLICGFDISTMRSNAVYCDRDCKLKAADRRRNARPSSLARKHARRARALGNRDLIDVTAAEWLAIRNRFGHRCAYCERSGPLQMDHVVPIVRGGRHAPANIVPACRSCNSSKGGSFIVEWRRRLKAKSAA